MVVHLFLMMFSSFLFAANLAHQISSFICLQGSGLGWHFTRYHRIGWQHSRSQHGMVASLVTIGGGITCMRVWIEVNAFDGAMYLLAQSCSVVLRVLDESPT
ncbi:hypothetical protein BDV34DRAFT_108816 [Aspergillus parasiticus]|uniref:Secreted protein n=1 Tax=Aspergillus parasiticus TaxID=5067 RepID=A0A5N6E1W3_ASPPA|nr:hypothetical protein BDV34DRAFT_108816 [Aspergillus parasiticus]